MRLFGEDSNGCIHDRWVNVALGRDVMRLIPGGHNGPIGNPVFTLEACWGCGILRVASWEQELTTQPLASDTKPTS